MATHKKSSEMPRGNEPRPIDDRSPSSDVGPGIRPFEVHFEDLPRVRDTDPEVRPFEVHFEDLPRVRDTSAGVQPFEARPEAPDGRGIEAGAAAFGRPGQA